jgi:hypothetical protein
MSLEDEALSLHMKSLATRRWHEPHKVSMDPEAIRSRRYRRKMRIAREACQILDGYEDIEVGARKILERAKYRKIMEEERAKERARLKALEDTTFDTPGAAEVVESADASSPETPKEP